jgi:outer membrane murein-binding lipoprotein Lpp
MGFGRQGAAASERDPQTDTLTAQIEKLETQLKAVREQIQTLSSSTGE